MLGLSGADPLDHAAGWNEHFSADPDTMGAALDEWAQYFAALDAGWITEGAVLMRRRNGDHHLVRADPADEDDLEFASNQIERVFAALALVAEEGAGAVLEARLTLAEEGAVRPGARPARERAGDAKRARRGNVPRLRAGAGHLLSC